MTADPKIGTRVRSKLRKHGPIWEVIDVLHHRNSTDVAYIKLRSLRSGRYRSVTMYEWESQLVDAPQD